MLPRRFVLSWAGAADHGGPTESLEGSDVNPAMQHLSHLCVPIGPREAGSAGNRAAADYIERVFAEAGLDVSRQPFPCEAWASASTEFELDGQPVEAAANWFSPACDVRGTNVPLRSIAQLKRADLRGCVAVLHGSLVSSPLSPKGNTVYNPESHQQIIRLLEEKRPEAVVTVSTTPRRLDLIKDPDLELPSVTVWGKAARSLVARPGTDVRVRVSASRTQGESCNVIGLKAPSGLPRVVLCAHYDSHPDGPAAVDNATGVAVLLSVARDLAQRTLPFGLEFVAFSAHELNGAGAAEYLRPFGLSAVPDRGTVEPGNLAPGLEHISLCINVDGVAHKRGPNTIIQVARPTELGARIRARIDADFPEIAWVEPWPASDHYTFYSHGVPAIALSSEGAWLVNHRVSDTVQQINPDKLEEAAAAVVTIVEAL